MARRYRVLTSAVMARSPQGVQTVTRALELLERIADNGEAVTVSVLATIAGLPFPTVHRLLKTLVALGYVRQLPSRRHALGPRCGCAPRSAAGCCRTAPG
jgi:IclR family acetate operon transcriptional repressor